MTRGELNLLKRKELTLLERLDKKGYRAYKKFTMTDKLDDITAERERLEDEKRCDEWTRWLRKILVGTSTGIEFLNTMYDPFDLKLEGGLNPFMKTSTIMMTSLKNYTISIKTRFM